jgi:hypothetical protein
MQGNGCACRPRHFHGHGLSESPAYPFASVTARASATRPLGSLGSGAVTAVALAVQQGIAALVGVIIAREFGRSGTTDGFFAAYGVFIVIALIATAVRAVLLPPLARARESGRLGGETTAFGAAFAVFAAPLAAVAILFATPAAALLTGFGPPQARDTAAATLPWLVVAAIGQLYAGLAASALAALDDYATAAAGYAIGSIAGLALILWRVGDDGIEAVAWGVALNGLLAAAVPTTALVLRARRAAMPAGGARPVREGRGRRLADLGAGVALPLVLQAVYLVCLPLAANEGTGAVTSLGYAYLAGSAVITVTASSLALVTSVPLTRAGLDGRAVAHHVVASAWIALVAVAATVGAFAVAGEPLAREVLGTAYGDDVGTQLGLVVLSLAPWIVVTVGISATFPLVFVTRRGSRLPLIALLAFAAHVPLAFAGQALAGLYGLAIALALSTAVALVAMLLLLDAARAALTGLGRVVVVLGALAACAFGGSALVVQSDAWAAVAGVSAYAAALAVTRPRGLRGAWRYLRALA